MGSGIFFPVCAIPFSLLMIVLLLKKEHIVNYETKIYKVLVILNFIGLIIEILCTYASLIYYEHKIISDFIYKTYLFYLISWTEIFTLYIYVISDVKVLLNKITKRLAILFTIIITIFIYCLPISLILKNNFQIRYTTGYSVYFSYSASGILVFIMLILIIKNIKNIINKKYIPIFVFFIIGTASIVIQSIFPQILLLTYVETFICVIMYFTIENPDMKLLKELHKAKTISDNSNEEKTMFIYNMTNDIRAITKNIDASCDNILDETGNKKVNIEVINDNARDIKASTARFTTMTNEILDISDMDINRIKIYDKKYNIKLIIKELVQTYKKECNNKNIEFRSMIESDINEYLYGDSVNLKKVLTIVLDNCIKYTNSGYIEFNISSIVKKDICRLIITIEDSGIGIKPEELSKILNNNRNELDDASDLSDTLYNAKKLITLMGGAMLVNSIVNNGTKVKIILDQKIAEFNKEINKYNNIYNNKKIIIADDNESSIKIFKKILDNSNITVDYVNNGKELLDRIRNKEKYDLILIDEDIKPQDAYIIIKKLKEIRNFNTKVILLTRNNNHEYNDDYKKHGFDNYILKPINKDNLFKIINNK